MRSGWVLVLAAYTGCVRPGAFVCADDSQCGAAGTCQPAGYCSFPDPDCEQGQRFGAQSGPFAGQCVGGSGSGSGTDSNSDEDAAPAGRATDGLVALYLFDEGAGSVALDTAGSAPALDLMIGAGTTWVTGGLQFAPGTEGAMTSGTADRAVTACIGSNEVTLEAWIQSSTAAMTTAQRIIGVAGTNNASAASLGQENTGYYGQVRTSMSSTKLASPAASARTTLLHLVHTRTPSGVRTLYLDAVAASATTSGGTMANWAPALPITVGNASDGGVDWAGTLFLAAIYCRALSSGEVMQNFVAGP